MPPIHIMLKPASGQCNMHCNYCFYMDEASRRQTRSYGTMSLDTLENIIKKTLAICKECCSFIFQGGEPTLAGLDFFKAAVEYEKKWNVNHVQIENCLQTNGILINEDWAVFLHKNRFLVGLSIDGTREIHNACRMFPNKTGTFDQVLQAVELFKKHHVEFNILTVVTGYAADHAKEIYSFYQKQGFEWQQYIPCLNPLEEENSHYDYSLSVPDYAKFLKTLFDCWYEEALHGHLRYVRYFIGLMNLLCRQAPGVCEMNGICSRQYVLEADGSIFPCDFYMTDEYLLGNYLTDSMEEIEKKRKDLQFIEKSEVLPSDCHNCHWLYLCRGGCKRDRLFSREDTYGKNRYCEAYQEFFKYAYPRLDKLVRLYSQLYS